MRIRGEQLSATLIQDYKDRCKYFEKWNFKEQIDWCISQINSLSEKQYQALLSFSKRTLKGDFHWNLIYNTDTYYHWLKAVTGKKEPKTEQIMKAYSQPDAYELDEQSKIDLGLEVEKKEVPKEVIPTTKITEKLLVLEEIDKKIDKHKKTGNKGALAGWQRMKDYIENNSGNFDSLLTEAESKKHNNPKLWDRVIYQLKAKKKAIPSVSPSINTQAPTTLDQIKEAIKKWSEIHGFGNDAARILVHERDALLGHGKATVTGSIKLVQWLEDLYHIKLTETRKRRKKAGV